MASRKSTSRSSPSLMKKSHPKKKAAKPRRPSDQELLKQAQKLVKLAGKTDDCGREVELALQALQLSPDCADAYMILAQHTFHAHDALPFFSEARRAAGKVLGKQAFRKHSGRFWARTETRTYMRASGGLAECYWITGCRGDAVELWREMLKLNSRDDQGVRYPFVAGLLEMQESAEASRLLQEFPEPTTIWNYHLALLAFQTAGDTPETWTLLQRARKSNKHVIPYLLKDESPPVELPDTIKPGSKAEAALYLTDAAAAWKQTEGAITWLRKATARKKAPTKPTKSNPLEGPTAKSKKALSELPQQYGLVYQAAVHQFPHWMEDGSSLVRPWVVVMVNYNERWIVAQELVTEKPTPHSVWERVGQGLTQPFAGKPCRPAEIQVKEHPVWEALRPHFQEIGIDIIYRESVDEIDAILSQLSTALAKGPPERGLLQAPGLTRARLGMFYTAAAEYYRAKPWQFCSDDRAIEVKLANDPQSPRFAVVLGQGGMAYGLAIYDQAESLYDLWSGDLNPDDSVGNTGCISVTFGEPFEMTAIDMQSVDDEKWPVAGPEAYPTILRTDADGTIRPPTASELEMVEVLLLAIPSFASRNHRSKSAEETLSVSTATGARTRARQLQLSWYESTDVGHDHDHDHGSCSVHGEGTCDHDHDDLSGS